ncbi:uncharacterized protein LAESUDRAFT_808802 [Laetiporus sulphureus 93-53]|uniref:Histone H1 n=1 Tax=Laetiporus sulphureus 93-53 TaxID=1314785 RepID=A0A165HK84_9APHY|nr:uncharacterized protein LAESUDRAFT_808802 [Laetiporus sulphureus 93-53]KZT11838.1 hypothetical protein LAESUDRAFT_808802 [Laetiporus sulphureus 93-53]
MSEPPRPPLEGAQLSPESSDESLKSLKRSYLSVLPQVEIIEICLAFEPHVPPQVRNTVWPADLEAAILALKKEPLTPANTIVIPTNVDPPFAPQPAPAGAAADVSSQQVHPPRPTMNGDVAPPMASLVDDASMKAAQQPQTDAPTTAVEPPQKSPETPTSVASTVASSTPAPPTASQSATASASTSDAPTPQSQPATKAQTHPHSPYPYAPYGYSPQTQQPAYPHTPYYAPPLPHSNGYLPPFHYAAYPPPPGYLSPVLGHAHIQSPYPSYPYSHSSPSHAGSVPSSSMPSQVPVPPPPADDLPSYEEMIVEALLDTGDPEGAAPKDLFAWMAAHYPLQTNFRPSASQALQKAYKRGRLEKRPSGRYRLNSTWEGGATSKRTTRRPQTLAQTTYAMHHPPQPPSSPFTNAPLQHHHHQQRQQPPYLQSNGPQAGAYPGYPYGYPPMGYPSYGTPGYPAFPSHDVTIIGKPGTTTLASSAIPATATLATSSLYTIASSDPATESASQENQKDSADGTSNASAWEAAQHILEAINFNLPADTPQQGTPATATASNSQYAPAGASTGIGFTGAYESAIARSSAGGQRITLTDEERASLQAQLALLAAQLAEIANSEEADEGEETDFVHVARPGDVDASSLSNVKAQDAVEKGKSVESSPSQSPEGASTYSLHLEHMGEGGPAVPVMPSEDVNMHLTTQETEDSDEDDDMEMVEVPAHAGWDALRT